MGGGDHATLPATRDDHGSSSAIQSLCARGSSGALTATRLSPWSSAAGRTRSEDLARSRLVRSHPVSLILPFPPGLSRSAFPPRSRSDCLSHPRVAPRRLGSGRSSGGKLLQSALSRSFACPPTMVGDGSGGLGGIQDPQPCEGALQACKREPYRPVRSPHHTDGATQTCKRAPYRPPSGGLGGLQGGSYRPCNMPSYRPARCPLTGALRACNAPSVRVHSSPCCREES